ncbi:MAG: maf protein [Candidatus Angelobacter sp.]|jgi:septum formation protein|nr:maf protein [Candidatus Angelobacter sp.]
MLILASSSPRRRELLRNAGIEFEVQAADVPEVHIPGETPLDFATRLAHAKAAAVAQQRPEAYVLGADTIVIVAGEILGKPADAADAARMLRLLSNKTHEVTTAVCVISPRSTKKDPIIASETTLVHMSTLSDEDIAAYIATGEPMDKAGAYAIQGIASRWITRIEGDYSNVVGLPIALVYRMMNSSF